EQTPARTPWWLLLLRIVIAALVITGAAQPMLRPPMSLPGLGPVIIVVDNGWASAYGWNARLEAAKTMLATAAREGRDAAIWPTAPDAETGTVQLTGPQPAAALQHQLESLQPQPWNVDHVAALKALQARNLADGFYTAWFSDSLRGTGTNE